MRAPAPAAWILLVGVSACGPGRDRSGASADATGQAPDGAAGGAPTDAGVCIDDTNPDGSVATFPNDASWPCLDGCNRCSCQNGQLSHTEIACPGYAARPGCQIGERGWDCPDASDAGPDDADAGDCTEPLDATGCVSAYSAAIAECTADAQPFFGPSAFASCGGLNAVVYGGGTTYRMCLYDDAGIAVAAVTESDVSEFCGQTAYIIQAGRVPGACSPEWVRGIQAGQVEAGACASPNAAADAADATSD